MEKVHFSQGGPLGNNSWKSWRTLTAQRMLHVCAVCSSPAPFTCSGCLKMYYCTPVHQKADWKRRHKKECHPPSSSPRSCDPALLLRVTACLARTGYLAEVYTLVQVSKDFWEDEQIWDAFKDYTTGYGYTRLAYVSRLGLLERTRWLLARGAKVNAAPAGITALMGASLNGQLEVVRELCAAGAHVNAVMRTTGITALIWACKEGHLEVVRELLYRGASLNAVEVEDGCTALIKASENGHLGVVHELVKRGANVNATNRAGKSALILACVNSHLEIVTELLEGGSLVNEIESANGTTALMNAAFNGNLAIVRLLLQKGAKKGVKAFNGENAYSLADQAPFHKPALKRLLKP
jgi:ankyrin repeat protein